jgi:hypothetical protein
MSQLKSHDVSTSRRWHLHSVSQFEKMDPNSSRYLEVNRGINSMFACYRERGEEKKKTTVQSSLDKFLRKACTFPISTAINQPSPVLLHLQINAFVIHHQNFTLLVRIKLGLR